MTEKQRSTIVNGPMSPHGDNFQLLRANFWSTKGAASTSVFRTVGDAQGWLQRMAAVDGVFYKEKTE